LTADEDNTMGASRERWPLRRGFERFYGFLGGETDQYEPDLVYDNHGVPPPRTAAQGYHLTEDLTDKAIEFLQDLKAVAPSKPFFLYLAYGANHAPHHVPKEWADRYKARFDMVSDNGASAEGGPTGSVNENLFFNMAPDDLQRNLTMLDELGGPLTYNHYPWGWTWAGNTPLRRWKRETYQGGMTDPFVVSWPAG